MSFLTLGFFVFLAILVSLYYFAFKEKGWLLLLCGSLVFYCFASPRFLGFLLLSVLSVYGAGILMEKVENKKPVFIITIVLNIGILAVVKYTGFFTDNFESILRAFGKDVDIAHVEWILPLGISFYTFMAISYLTDVYWGVYEAQTSLLKLVLYLSYFPHITSGPIDNYASLRSELYEFHEFNLDGFLEGLYRIVKGLFKKLVIAERLAVYVDAVYADPNGYGGLTLLAATVFYAFQMYCDFSGYIDIAIGVSKLFGIELTENFNLPYFSKSIAEYWRRWHITLGVWFRTYVFYPVIRSGFCKRIKKSIRTSNKKLGSTITTVIGLLCVWFLTGLWHGASWHYVAHGMFHGTIIIFGTILAGFYDRLRKFFRIKEESKLFHAFQIARTFILVDFSYILFRADSVHDAGIIIRKIFTDIHVGVDELKSAILPFTQDNTAVSYAGVCIMALFMLIIAELFEYNGNDFFKRHKYMSAGIMIVVTALFGVFGQSSFLYAAY